MGKRLECSECRIGLLHLKRFSITEVEGQGSGKKVKTIGQYCIDCYRKRFSEVKSK